MQLLWSDFLKKLLSGLIVLTSFGAASDALAVTYSKYISYTATLQGSLSVTVESAGGSATGLNTSAASTSLGNVSKYGTAPSGFTLTRGASNWTLASTIGVKVAVANITTSSYTLTAQLAGAPPSGVSWTLNSSAITAASPLTLTTTGTYATTPSYAWTIVTNDSASAAALNNTINFVAISN